MSRIFRDLEADNNNLLAECMIEEEKEEDSDEYEQSLPENRQNWFYIISL